MDGNRLRRTIISVTLIIIALAFVFIGFYLMNLYLKIIPGNFERFIYAGIVALFIFILIRIIVHSLEKLVSLRLCYKESESIRGGGHKNIYYAIPPGSVRNDAVSILEDFYLAMKEKAECLDQYIAMEISKYASAYSENR